MIDHQFESQLHIVLKKLSYLHKLDFSYTWIRISVATLLCIFILQSNALTSLSLMLTWYFSVFVLAIACFYSSTAFVNYHSLKANQLKKSIDRYSGLSFLFNTMWSLSSVYLYSTAALEPTILLIPLTIFSIMVINIKLFSTKEFYINIAILFLPLIIMLLMNGGPFENSLAISLIIMALAIVFVAQNIANIIDFFAEENSTLLDQVQTDAVTQLMDSRFFSQTMKSEWRRAARNQYCISLQLVEIDDYSFIEQNCSITTCNQHLQLIADCMNRVVRRGGDVIARRDQSSFFIMLPETSAEHSLEIAEKIERRIENMALTKSEGNHKSSLTVSIGVATCFPSQALEAVTTSNKSTDQSTFAPSSLINAAEHALQLAKKEKNQQRVEPKSVQGDRINLAQSIDTSTLLTT